MKKILSLTAIIFAGFVTLQAQDVKSKEGKQKHAQHKKMGEKRQHQGKMMKNIDFTEAQKAQMKAINEDHRKQMQELQKNENITVKEQRSQRAAIQKDHREKMQSLMTTEQKDQMAKAKTAQRKQRAEAGKQRSEKMKTELGLSNDQAARLAESNKVAAEKMKAIKANESLTQQQKMEQVKAVKAEQKKKRESILTSEQLSKMKEMNKGPRHQRGHKGKK